MREQNKVEMAEIHAPVLRVVRPPSNPAGNSVLRNVCRRFRSPLLVMALAVQTIAAVGQLSTQDHVAAPGFWPTKSQPSRKDYAGPEACARCHAAKSAAQKETPMARGLMPATSAEILQSNPALTFSVGDFKYRIDASANQAEYSVTNGNQHISYPLEWAVGTGRAGQSYLFKNADGGFYEARASYFPSLKSLDFTPGRDLPSPSSVEEAMYRPVKQAEVQQCFACHSTASTLGGRFDEKDLIQGITCEACHGPGANHVRSMDAGSAEKRKTSRREIFNPDSLSPADAVDFCGACHSTFWDVKLAGISGVSMARSAPYRLATSKCWGNGDARLTCVACHDPHKQLETDAVAYDPICLSCHINSPAEKTSTGHPGAACPKAVSDCTNCHMEKVYIPEMHANFTDHRIRVVKPGEPFPE